MPLYNPCRCGHPAPESDATLPRIARANEVHANERYRDERATQ
jgi:hypothetical protein